MASSRIVPVVAIMALLLILGGCYHMRAEPEPIKPRVFKVNLVPAEALKRIRNVLEGERRLRILEEQNQGAILVTAPWHFATDTGFGQPAGGRKYYTQLLVEVVVQNGGTQVTLSPYSYEMRSTYAYGENGQVETLNKHYPYEHYPGMFDNNLLTAALNEMAATMQRACSE